MNKIDIAITTYNRSDLLERAILSVLAQDDQEFTLYVLDNQSTDDTESVCKRLLSPPHRYIRNAENLGMSGNWNASLEVGTAQYLNILHDDDELAANFVSSVRAFIDQHPDCALIHTAVDYIDLHSNVTMPKVYDYPAIVSGDHYFQDWVNKKVDIVCPAAIFNRGLLPSDLRFSAELPFTADLVFFLQATAFGPVGYIRDRVFRYRRHIGSTTSSLRAKIHSKIGDRRFAGRAMQHEVDQRKLPLRAAKRTGENYMYNSLAADILFTRLLGGRLSDVFFVAKEVAKSEPALLRRPRFYRMLITAFVPPNLSRQLAKYLRKISFQHGRPFNQNPGKN